MSMKRMKAESIDAYIDDFPKNIQQILKQIRTLIRKEAPGAAEKISYGIPCFTMNGKNMVFFAGYKNHVSIYPAPRGVESFEILDNYEGGKGTVQFPIEKPLPVSLITKIVKYRVKENQEKAKSKTKKKGVK